MGARVALRFLPVVGWIALAADVIWLAASLLDVDVHVGVNVEVEWGGYQTRFENFQFTYVGAVQQRPCDKCFEGFQGEIENGAFLVPDVWPSGLGVSPLGGSFEDPARWRDRPRRLRR